MAHYNSYQGGKRNNDNDFINLFSRVIMFLLLTFVVYSCSKDSGSVPSVTTYPIHNLTHNHVVSGGYVDNHARGAEGITRGVCWSTTPQPTVDDFSTEIVYYFYSGDIFLSYINELLPNTTYYLRAYAIHSTGIAYGDQQIFTTFPDYTGQIGTVTDIEGNNYSTIGIGSQIWMAENLRTTKFNDATIIPDGSTDELWRWLYSPGFCVYNNDLSNKATYGLLYNWQTANTSANGYKNVCPIGWHVPDNKEWETLTGYLGESVTGNWTDSTSNVEGCRIAGKMLKESGTLHWLSGNTGTDDFGFSALPGGCRSENGDYAQITMTGYWWSSSEWLNPSGDNKVSFVSTEYLDNEGFHILKANKHHGYSIRCIKDQTSYQYN